MPVYEYRCRRCDERFEVRRPMTAPVASTPACPAGHLGAVRVFSVAATLRPGAGPGVDGPAPGAGGGCCGGACGCR